MKQYNRAKQKRIDFNSIIENTISEYEEDRIQARRSNKRKTLQPDPKDDGEREHQSRRSSQAHGHCPNESESSYVQKKRSEFRISFEDGREYRPGCGAEGAPDKIGEVA